MAKDSPGLGSAAALRLDTAHAMTMTKSHIYIYIVFAQRSTIKIM